MKQKTGIKFYCNENKEKGKLIFKIFDSSLVKKLLTKSYLKNKEFWKFTSIEKVRAHYWSVSVQY